MPGLVLDREIDEALAAAGRRAVARMAVSGLPWRKEWDT